MILTNADDAVNFKLVTAPVDDPGREHWEELVPHRPDVKLEGVSAFAGHLVRYERREGVRRIVVTPYGAGCRARAGHARGGVRHRPGHQRRVHHQHAPLHLHVAGHAGHRVRRGPRHGRAHAPQDHRGARRPRPGRLRHRTAVGHRPRRHPGADLVRAPRRRRAGRLGPVPPLRLRLLRDVHRPRLLDPPPVAARPRLRVRHRPRPRRRGDGPTLVRRRQAPPQAQHLHRLHRVRRAPRGRAASRPPTAWWRGARRPAGC